MSFLGFIGYIMSEFGFQELLEVVYVVVFTNFFKLIERIFYEQMISFLDTNILLIFRQFGLRFNMSTVSKLLSSADVVTAHLALYEAFDSVYLDISETFDKSLELLLHSIASA